jgi:hypothetical protein
MSGIIGKKLGHTGTVFTDRKLFQANQTESAARGLGLGLELTNGRSAKSPARLLSALLFVFGRLSFLLFNSNA